MYAIAIIRYRKPIEEVLAAQEEHRAYLRDLKQKGTVIASGPLDPRYGGALLLRISDGAGDAALDGVRDGDPFVKRGIAQYELMRWVPGMGKEDLDRL
jgi:uncharacterized protein YciI